MAPHSLSGVNRSLRLKICYLHPFKPTSRCSTRGDFSCFSHFLELTCISVIHRCVGPRCACGPVKFRYKKHFSVKKWSCFVLKNIFQFLHAYRCWNAVVTLQRYPAVSHVLMLKRSLKLSLHSLSGRVILVLYSRLCFNCTFMFCGLQIFI